LQHITEFMRQVIESGADFTHNHFYIMVLSLDAEMMTEQLGRYLQVIVDKLGVTIDEYKKFLG